MQKFLYALKEASVNNLYVNFRIGKKKCLNRAISALFNTWQGIWNFYLRKYIDVKKVERYFIANRPQCLKYEFMAEAARA